MQIEIDDDADRVEVLTYRDGVLFTQSVYAFGGAFQSHALCVPVSVEALMRAQEKDNG